MKYESFTDLRLYKKCRKLKIAIAEMMNTRFPKEETYSLKSQLRNSSRSITANIAEGHGRYYYQDNIRFCRIARGSLDESLDHLITAYDEKYINESELKNFKILHEECLRLLNGYIKYLRNSKKGKADNSI